MKCHKILSQQHSIMSQIARPQDKALHSYEISQNTEPTTHYHVLEDLDFQNITCCYISSSVTLWTYMLERNWNEINYKQPLCID